MSGLGNSNPASEKRLPRPAIGTTMLSMLASPYVLVVRCPRDFHHYIDGIGDGAEIRPFPRLQHNDIARRIPLSVHLNFARYNGRDLCSDLMVVPFLSVIGSVRLD